VRSCLSAVCRGHMAAYCMVCGLEVASSILPERCMSGDFVIIISVTQEGHPVSWLMHRVTDQEVPESNPDESHYGPGVYSACNRNENKTIFMGTNAASGAQG
jgi:hypothetical protein